jgi:hypothetical protein
MFISIFAVLLGIRWWGEWKDGIDAAEQVKFVPALGNKNLRV